MNGLLILQVIVYGFALWLGLYLLTRDFSNLHLRYASLGLMSYALLVMGNVLYEHAPNSTAAEWFARLSLPLVISPALFWFMTLLYLLEDLNRDWLIQLKRMPWLLIMPAFLIYIASASTNIFFDYKAEPPTINLGYLLIFALVIPAMGTAIWLLIQSRRHTNQKFPLSLILLATLFFGLSVGILLTPADILPREWLIVAVSLDIFTFGFLVAVLDAFAQGENLRRDMLRALDVSFITSFVFAGQVAFVMHFSTGLTFGMLILLFSILSAAIGLQMFSNPLARLVDELAFSSAIEAKEELKTLRTTANIMTRQKLEINFQTIDNTEFARLTRRALRDFGNLPKLASNPLTQLPLVTERLQVKDRTLTTLERAAELKVLLTERIEALKPPENGGYGVSDEWRFYNALFYPYVVGIRPYSRRTDHSYLEADDKTILEWFRSQVPERTLYNWQKKAAELIAQDLREGLSL